MNVLRKEKTTKKRSCPLLCLCVFCVPPPHPQHTGGQGEPGSLCGLRDGASVCHPPAVPPPAPWGHCKAQKLLPAPGRGGRCSRDKPRSCFRGGRTLRQPRRVSLGEADPGAAGLCAHAGGDAEQVLWQQFAAAPINGVSSPGGVMGSLPSLSPPSPGPPALAVPGSGVSAGRCRRDPATAGGSPWPLAHTGQVPGSRHK